MKLYEYPRVGWQEEFAKLMQDPYLSKKYNRERRIKDNRKYMGAKTPELKHAKNKRVLDIGPGPGEWLEICREFGHQVWGVDAPLSDCEMGDEYIRLSKLMTERQKLSVDYCGLQAWLKKQIGKGKFFYINCRGAIEQCFKDHQAGVPHKVTKNCSGLKWVITQELWDKFEKMFKKFSYILEDGGYIVIHANGSKNNPDYDNLVLETLKKFPELHLMKKEGKLFHKIQKRV